MLAAPPPPNNRYDRADGVTMTATLHLPPGYDQARDGALPCILWAYPREFKSREAAGQMRRSPHQFSGERLLQCGGRGVAAAVWWQGCGDECGAGARRGAGKQTAAGRWAGVQVGW
jgi:hypothetical protein